MYTYLQRAQWLTYCCPCRRFWCIKETVSPPSALELVGRRCSQPPGCLLCPCTLVLCMTHAGTHSGTEWHKGGYWTAAPASGQNLLGSQRSSDRKSSLQARPARQWHEVPRLLLWAKQASRKQPEGGMESLLLHNIHPATQHTLSKWTVCLCVCVNYIKGLLKDHDKISMSIISGWSLNTLVPVFLTLCIHIENLLPRDHI